MDILLTLDLSLFRAINLLPHTPLTDWTALFFSGVGKAGIIWFVFGILLFLREERKDHRFFAPIVATGACCYLFIELILKYVVGRPRPDAGMGALVLDTTASWYSFPSSHATLSWAMAVVLTRYEPKLKWFWYALAFVISVSRIYLGVHYPVDVVAGSLIGAGIGTLMLALSGRWGMGQGARNHRRSRR